LIYLTLPLALGIGKISGMSLPHKLATLLYCFDPKDRLLLLKRNLPPNVGRWVPPGGKVEVNTGESPYACACREANEETGLEILPKDLHLTGLISENGYEGNTHWYIFLFEIKPRLLKLPKPCDEGEFKFFTAKEIDKLDIPRTDREQIWPLFQKHRGGFFSGHFHCLAGDKFDWALEESVRIEE
jgi:8-oxo-dGTP diphosphatase